MNTLVDTSEWYLFDMRVEDILKYLEHCTGQAYVPQIQSPQEANKWHLALREGLHTHLHLDVGIPGIEAPAHPLVENESALHAALLLRIPVLRVILSGEWETAVGHGLISRQQLAAHETAMRQHFGDDATGQPAGDAVSIAPDPLAHPPRWSGWR